MSTRAQSRKTKQPVTVDELRTWPAAVDLKAAARALNIGMTKAYELARDDDFPVRLLRLGGAYRVSTADLLAYLGVRTEPADESAA